MRQFDIRNYQRGQAVGQVRHAGQAVDYVVAGGKLIYSADPVLLPETTSRIVDDAGERWFEFGFLSPEILTGNSGTGWTDAGTYCRLHLEWSLDLVNWSFGKFIPAPVPVVAVGDGTSWYWSRALNPQDSAAKTGALFFDNGNGYFPDARRNGFTAVVLAGVSLALPHFPYDMSVAGTAAQLQADIRAAGFPGTIVTGTTAEDWTVAVPSVAYTSYAQGSYLLFPGYLVEDMFGVLNTTIDRVNAVGTFVDAAGTPVCPKAFARLGVTAGTRYP